MKVYKIIILGLIRFFRARDFVKRIKWGANEGQITVEQVLWVIFIVAILCGIVYTFISGWFTGLLNSMKDTTDAKLDTVIN